MELMKNKQRGVVLIVALVFLASLTAVASALMLNATTDVKISGASEDKLIAMQEAISAVEETVSIQITSGNNLFAQSNFPQTIANLTSTSVDSVILANRNFNTSLPDCPHQRNASSTKLIKCNLLNLSVLNNYGKTTASKTTGTSAINVDSGIAQELLNVGN